MELSRPTVRGKTAWGNKTVSRTGKTAIRRRLELSLPAGDWEESEMGRRFGIECPLISFSSLDHADFEKFQEKSFFPDSPFCEPGNSLWYGPGQNSVPMPDRAAPVISF
jgi:hypothetical protein